jgi:hypothetical protein
MHEGQANLRLLFFLLQAAELLASNPILTAAADIFSLGMLLLEAGFFKEKHF